MLQLIFLFLSTCVLLGNCQRPPPNKRLFNSTAINDFIQDLVPKMKDPKLAELFTNCFPNTLDTTVFSFTPGDSKTPPDTFVITGDITAMWLRDSMNQVLPYLPFAKTDLHLRTMLCGVIHRQAKSILLDPYANAFNIDANGNGHQSDVRKPPMTKPVFEGKYELDSLVAFLKLSNRYVQDTGDQTCFLKDQTWMAAVDLAYQTITAQQKGSQESLPHPPYYFQRLTRTQTDTLMLVNGTGTPALGCGLSKSFFRPSDDATTFPFLIPSNAMAVVELRATSTLIASINQELSYSLLKLANEIDTAIRIEAIMKTKTGDIFAYEVDGFGSQYFMDDANIPSLLSLPYLGYIPANDPFYLQTRAAILSTRNPYWFKGTVASGVGGPHVGLNMIWPMSLMIQALTTDNDQEIITILDILKETSFGSDSPFMHESFDKDNVKTYTRPWFAWANSLYGELIITLTKSKPHIILKEGYW